MAIASLNNPDEAHAMLDSVSSIAALATQMSTQKTAQQVEVAVLAKAKEMQEQQGQNALKLLESASVPTNGIDVRA
jgi:proteasome assembly chaperone (PAC2) family protein